MSCRLFFASSCLGLVVVIAATGCSDRLNAPEHTELDRGAPTAHSTFAAQAQDVRAVDIDLPPEPRPWDVSAEGLEDAIAAEDGYAVIAFKSSQSARALSTGRRAAVAKADIEAGLSLLAERGVEVLDYWAFIGAVYVRLRPGVATTLRDHTQVDFIEPRHRYTVQGVPGPVSAPMAGAVQGQTTPWGMTVVRAPEAWSVATGDGADIQIIDTGHDRGHEDLPLVPVGNCAGAYGGCDDGPFWHGTHVLGIFTARDNEYGVVGTAQGVAENDVHVYGACQSVYPYGCDTPGVIDGIEASLWMDVLNMSFGGAQYSADMATAVAQAWNNGWGVVMVAAAGNRGNLHTPPAHFYPAEYANVIGVSGVRTDATFAGTSPCTYDADETMASDYGAWVDLAAPFWALSTVGNNGYEDEDQGWCGTSMAAPHVAGAAALLRSQHPDWSAQQIVDRLFATALDKGGAGRDNYYGYGILDAAYAVGLAPPPPPPPPPMTVTISGPTTWPAYQVVAVQALVSYGTPPFTYAWKVNGSPACGNQNWCSRAMGARGTSVYFYVTVTDHDGDQASDYHIVTAQ